MAALCLVYSHFNDCWLLSVQAQTLIQALALIWITTAASIFKARHQSSSSSVVSCWNHSVLFVDNHSAHWTFHAVGSSTSNISNFHEVLFPWGSERFYDLLFLKFNLVFQKLSALSVTNSSFYEFQTFFEFFIILLIVFDNELFKLLRCVFNLSFNDKVMVSFEGWSLYQDDIHKISFFKIPIL